MAGSLKIIPLQSRKAKPEPSDRYYYQTAGAKSERVFRLPVIPEPPDMTHRSGT